MIVPPNRSLVADMAQFRGEVNEGDERKAAGREGGRTCWGPDDLEDVESKGASGPLSAPPGSRARARVTDAFNAPRVAAQACCSSCSCLPPHPPSSSSPSPSHGVRWTTQHHGSTCRPLRQRSIQPAHALDCQKTNYSRPWSHVSCWPCYPCTLSNATAIKS